MPLAIAIIIRAAIQMAITLAAIEAGSWLLERAISLTAKAFGATDEQAADIVANAWLQGAEALGIGILTLRAKMPLKMAERLGFTTKGYKPRPSIGGTKPIKGTLGRTTGLTSQQTAGAIEEGARTIAASGRSTFQTASNIASILIAALGIPVGMGLLITNTIDFGAWSSSAYQTTFQKILAIFGLEPDKDYIKAKVLSQEMSTKILEVYSQQGAKSIQDPRTKETLPFNRENFTKIADFVATQIIFENGSVSTKQMIGAMTALVTLGSAPLPSNSITGRPVTMVAAGLSDNKVFTGIVSQGTLGAGLTFVPRPDDLIETLWELQDAAQNNLASYLTTLPGKVIYEIRVVSSVTTKDGFKQVGTSHQIITGYHSNGNPKYKTIVNKFAILDLFILTDRGTKSKLGRIILGPTDALKLQPTLGALTQLEKTIQNNILTTDINAIQNIQNGSANYAKITPALPPGETSQTPNEPEIPAGEPKFTGGSSTWGNILTQFFEWGGKNYSFELDMNTIPPGSVPTELMKNKAIEAVKRGNPIEHQIGSSSQIANQRMEERKFDFRGGPNPTIYFPETNETIGLPPGTTEDSTLVDQIVRTGSEYKTPKEKITRLEKLRAAKNLAEFYGALEQALPPIGVRAKIYENANLGQAGFYLGTAEQNTKLLNWLKEHPDLA